MKRLLAVLLIGGGAASADIAFDWPVDCTLGQSCHIQNYVDADPGPAYRDFTCGALSYDGHTGTDIALATRDQIAQGVTVRAAAAGRVQGVRDEMPDVLFTDQDLQGRDCGNGVVIDHGGGWVTQYCHLRRGSVAVKSGDQVRPGTPLGQIGLSGRTAFAHLHFTIRKDGAPVDPFDPEASATCNAAPDQTLWAQDTAYGAGGLLDIGFADHVPEFDAIKAGTVPATLSPDAPLVLFGYAFGGRPGDIMRLTITGPGGDVITQDAEITRNRAQYFRAAGRRAPGAGWPAGTYDGTVTLLRDGQPLTSQSLTTQLP